MGEGENSNTLIKVALAAIVFLFSQLPLISPFRPLHLGEERRVVLRIRKHARPARIRPISKCPL